MEVKNRYVLPVDSASSYVIAKPSFFRERSFFFFSFNLFWSQCTRFDICGRICRGHSEGRPTEELFSGCFCVCGPFTQDFLLNNAWQIAIAKRVLNISKRLRRYFLLLHEWGLKVGPKHNQISVADYFGCGPLSSEFLPFRCSRKDDFQESLRYHSTSRGPPNHRSGVAFSSKNPRLKVELEHNRTSITDYFGASGVRTPVLQWRWIQYRNAIYVPSRR